MKALIALLDSDFNLTGLRQVPDSALLLGGRPMFLPDDNSSVRLSAMPAVRISRLGLAIAPKFARRYYDAATVVALRVPPQGDISEFDLVADSSLAVGAWLPVPEGTWTIATPDGPVASADLTPVFDSVISRISQRTTFKTGDIVALRLDIDPVPAHIDSRPLWRLQEAEALKFKIK